MLWQNLALAIIQPVGPTFDEPWAKTPMVKNCLIVSIGYACLDVLVLFGLASGSLGPSPFDLMGFLVFVSIAGGVFSILLLASSRKTRFTLLAGSFMLVLYTGLTLLNVWCLHLASAAV